MRSLKARLITVAAVWVVASVVVAGVLLSSQFKGFLVEQFYHELHEHLDELEGVMALDEGAKVRMERALSDPRFSMPLSGYYWEVQQNGDIAARSNRSKARCLRFRSTAAMTRWCISRISGPTGDLLIAERLRWLNGEQSRSASSLAPTSGCWIRS